MRFRLSAISFKTLPQLAASVCLAALSAGCSSYVTRFDDGMFTGSVPEPVGSIRAQPAAAQPVQPGPYDTVGLASPSQQLPANTHSSSAPQPVADSAAWRTAPAVEPQQSQIELASVPDPAPAAGDLPSAVQPNATPARSDAAAGSDDRLPQNGPAPTPAPKRQSAALPATTSSRQIEPPTGALDSVPSATEAPAPSVTPVPGSTYTVQSGDSLIGIASRAGIRIAALQEANGLNTSAIRVGQELKIPGSGEAETKDETTAAPQPDTPASTEPEATETASIAEKSKVQAAAPQTTGIGKLRWPANGQIMSGFGAVDGGSKNDGIDISLPKGTPVKAAENGVVIYSGGGLKEYGNTVLVRHDDGLVTVYGHASELMVQRGDTVTRGQVVALSGMSGEASVPKLHFEIRKDAKPVDPLTYLE